jgi:hypothetical protein
MAAEIVENTLFTQIYKLGQKQWHISVYCKLSLDASPVAQHMLGPNQCSVLTYCLFS